MLPFKPHIWYDITNAGMSWICGSSSPIAIPPYGHGDTPAEAYASWVKRTLDYGIRVTFPNAAAKMRVKHLLSQ